MFWDRMFYRMFGRHRRTNADAQWPSGSELKGRPVGRVLLKLGKVTREQVIEALKHQRAHGGMLGEAFVRLGHVKPDEVAAALAAQRGNSI
jgi:type IV pilus assembly protein PilB